MTAPRILVVEDERIIALHLRQQLTALGYDVPNAVSTGDHALHRIKEAPPDLVLMDINLKGPLDGIETAAAIPPGYHIPIIYLTAWSDDATLRRAAATNPYGYLLKPFSERELHAMIQMTLARSKTERATRASLESREQARKMEALRQLAGGLADEINGLLTALYGQLEELGNHAIGEPAMAKPIQDAFGEAIEKERLIHRLLDFSGRRKLTPAAVALNDLVSNVTDLLRHTVGDAVRVNAWFPSGLWNVRIDCGQFARALTLLATNAREAMPRGGTLTIEGQNVDLTHHIANGGANMPPPDETIERYVLLSVADTGIGMTERVLERAFEPFFTTKPAGGGTGLGLSLVFGFIRQSGGHISIDSRERDGTTVRLYLPAAPDDMIAVSPAVPVGSVRPSGGDPSGDQSAKILSKGASRATRSKMGWPDGRRVRHGPPNAPRADLAAPVLWHKAENALFATVLVRSDRLRYRLIVEPLPRRDGWDWTVWRPGDAEETSRHGRASSVVSAMAAAEDAARHWEKIEPTGD
jgi:signal transduction histidine kinase